MMKKYILIAVLFSVGLLNAQDLNSFFTKADLFFNKNVKHGKLDYTSIYKNQTDLDALLSNARSINVTVSMADNYKAFWINAYNLSVIKGIVDMYPAQSPLDNKGFFDKTMYNLAGKEVTLNTIENTLLRAQFKDARFHFVLVCGAMGCPPILNKAYLPETLNTQLETQTKIAINGRFLKVNTKKKRVEASEILKWYKEDFTRDGMTEIDFINTYRIEKIPTNFKLTYFPYNWDLNTL